MPSSAISKTKKQLRSLFRSSKKKKNDDTSSASLLTSEASSAKINNSVLTTDQPKKSKPLAWTPEEIMDAMHGMDIPASCLGIKLLLEIGQVYKGWLMDFSQNKIVISRYDVLQSKSKKPPAGPPKVHAQFQNIPWVWYKDRKVFSKIENGKMSDTVAYVMGKIAVSGDSSKFDLLETVWNRAKEIAVENRTNTKKNDLGALLVGSSIEEMASEDEEDDEEDVDEEARIIATYKPEIEPRNLCTKAFWTRHFGTDALVSAYLFLLSSVGYLGLMLYNTFLLLQQDKSGLDVPGLSKLAHDLANSVAAVFFVLGSVYFIKMSYPEVTMIMMYRAATTDPNTMGFMERYFTANEMLIALWLFCFAFLIPYFIVMIYEFTWLHAYRLGLQDTFIFLVACLLSFIFNVGAMPDGMRMNNGKGSSFFFDYCGAPLLFLKCNCWCQSAEKSDKRSAFWHKHLGNDMLATAWIFAVLGVGGSISVIPSVVEDPESFFSWMLFIAVVPFGVGSLLLLRASYPETMNSSFCCQFNSEGEEEGNEKDSIVQVGLSEPLL